MLCTQNKVIFEDNFAERGLISGKSISWFIIINLFISILRYVYLIKDQSYMHEYDKETCFKELFAWAFTDVVYHKEG